MLEVLFLNPQSAATPAALSRVDMVSIWFPWQADPVGACMQPTSTTFQSTRALVLTPVSPQFIVPKNNMESPIFMELFKDSYKVKSIISFEKLFCSTTACTDFSNIQSKFSTLNLLFLSRHTLLSQYYIFVSSDLSPFLLLSIVVDFCLPSTCYLATFFKRKNSTHLPTSAQKSYLQTSSKLHKIFFSLS